MRQLLYSETSTNSSKNPPDTFSFVSFLPLRREICCKTEPWDQDTDATSLETLERVWEAGKGRPFLNQGQQFWWSHREETTEAAWGGESTVEVSTRREKSLHPFSETDLRRAATSFPSCGLAAAHIPSLLTKATSIGMFKLSKRGSFAGLAFSWLKPYSVWDYH